MVFTKEEIDQAIEDEQLHENLYLKGILDFIKWTSAIATAALLWVGNALSSFTGLPQILAFLGLLFFIFSIGVAVITVKQVLTAWARKWDMATEASYVLRTWNPTALRKANELESRFGHLDPAEYFAEMTRVGESYPSADLVIKELEQLEPMIKALNAASPYSSPRKFSSWVSWHVSLLLVGLLLYVVAQAFGAF
jgi:hypothetical protein